MVPPRLPHPPAPSRALEDEHPDHELTTRATCSFFSHSKPGDTQVILPRDRRHADRTITRHGPPPAPLTAEFCPEDPTPLPMLHRGRKSWLTKRKALPSPQQGLSVREAGLQQARLRAPAPTHPAEPGERGGSGRGCSSNGDVVKILGFIREQS